MYLLLSPYTYIIYAKLKIMVCHRSLLRSTFSIWLQFGRTNLLYISIGEAYSLITYALGNSYCIKTRHSVHVFGYVIKFFPISAVQFSMLVSHWVKFGSKDHVREFLWLVSNYLTAVVNNVAQGNAMCDQLYLNNFTKYTID